MKGQVLFVHGAGEGAHEEDEKLAASLRDALGDGYEVRHPQMPDEDSPEAAAWKERIAGEIAAMDGGPILVGHSAGAFVLLKYLSEEEPEKPVAGLFLVATPYLGTGGWEIEEGALREDFVSRLPEGLPVSLYHGRDDEVVPFEHLALYAKKLPHATLRGLDGRGHQLGDDLSEVARDIGEVVGRAGGAEVRDGAGGAATDARWQGDLPPELGRPARRALAGAGYRRLEQLDGLEESEVGGLHGVGPKALGQLRRALASRGLSFARGEQDNRLPEEEA